MSIIDHWGQYGTALQPFAGPGHWHDMDMLLIGNGCITHSEEMTQMAIWAISASPLIMGNDMRNVSDASKAILKNKDAIAVSQDPLGQMGIRLSGDTPTQVWARVLANGDVAVALYNKGSAAPPVQPPIPPPPCNKWTATRDGYYEAAGGAAGNVGSFSVSTAIGTPLN
jgi:alpha-galactosidase